MSYVTMTHPQNGVTIVYLDAEVEANKLNGWVVQEETEVAAEKCSLKDRYFKKFGKLPHHRLSDKNIELALEE